MKKENFSNFGIHRFLFKCPLEKLLCQKFSRPFQKQVNIGGTIYIQRTYNFFGSQVILLDGSTSGHCEFFACSNNVVLISTVLSFYRKGSSLVSLGPPCSYNFNAGSCNKDVLLSHNNLISHHINFFIKGFAFNLGKLELDS